LIKRKEEKKGNISFVYYKERKNNLEFLSYFADLIEKEKEIEDVNNKKEAIIIENILKEKDKLLVYVDIEEKNVIEEIIKVSSKKSDKLYLIEKLEKLKKKSMFII